MFLKKLFHVAVKVATWVLPPVGMALVSIFTGGLALPAALAIGFAASYAIDRMHTFSLKADALIDKQERYQIRHALIPSSTPASNTTPTNGNSSKNALKKSTSHGTLITPSKITESPYSFSKSRKFFQEPPPPRIEFTGSSNEGLDTVIPEKAP